MQNKSRQPDYTRRQLDAPLFSEPNVNLVTDLVMFYQFFWKSRYCANRPVAKLPNVSRIFMRFWCINWH